jgi:FkbM family methyltransferase
MLSVFSEIKEQGIDFIDIGCSGDLDAKWKPLSPLLNYVGFDPNREECQRLSSLPSPFKKTLYLPYAVADNVGEAVLNQTESPYCSSLLRPRHEWLRRFTYHQLFQVIGQSKVNCVTLDYLNETEGLRANIMKLDTQGLELPILRSASRILPHAFCVETETGFVENYVGETVTAELDEFMRHNGFLLFDLEIHRVGRANHLARRSRQQPIWCESLWMRDYKALESWDISVPAPNRSQAVKALYICKALGFPDFGFELAQHFHAHGLLNDRELTLLSDSMIWGSHIDRATHGLRRLFLLLPRPLRRSLYYLLGASLDRLPLN